MSWQMRFRRKVDLPVPFALCPSYFGSSFSPRSDGGREPGRGPPSSEDAASKFRRIGSAAVPERRRPARCGSAPRAGPGTQESPDPVVTLFSALSASAPSPSFHPEAIQSGTDEQLSPQGESTHRVATRRDCPLSVCNGLHEDPDWPKFCAWGYRRVAPRGSARPPFLRGHKSRSRRK